MKTPEERREYYRANKERINAARKAWQARPEVRERISAARRKRWAEDPEFRAKDSARRKRNRDPEKQREYRRRYWQRHGAEVLARRKPSPPKPRTDEDRAKARAYYRANKESILARTRAWQKAHRPQINARRQELRGRS